MHLFNKVFLFTLIFGLVGVTRGCTGDDHLVRTYFDITTVNPASSLPGTPITVSVMVDGDSRGPGVGNVRIETSEPENPASCSIKLVNGRGSCQISFHKTGNMEIIGNFEGDAWYVAERRSVKYTVVAPLTPTPQIATSIYILEPDTDGETYDVGRPISFNVQVNYSSHDLTAPVPGTVNIVADDGTNCKISLSNNEGRCSLNFVTPGKKQVKAIYPINGVYMPSETSGITVKVLYPTRIDLTSSANPAAKNQMVTFTANVVNVNGGPTPTGAVEFSLGGDYPPCLVDLVDGSASCQFYIDKVSGGIEVQAIYNPTGSDNHTEIFNVAEGLLTQVVKGPENIVPPTPTEYKPDVSSGNSGQPGCMVAENGTFECVAPCPDPSMSTYPEPCTK
jgi:hypothetical protein